MSMTSRVATSATALPRFSAARPSALSRFKFTPQTSSLIFIRHVASQRSAADEETITKSGDMFNALIDSIKHLKSPSASQSTSTSSATNFLTPDSAGAIAPTDPTPPANKVSESDTLPAMIPPAKDPLLDYLAAVLQQHGHRARADRQVSRMLLHIHTFTRAPPVPIVRHAIMQAAPAVKVVSFKYGTKVLQTPQALTEKQRVRAAVISIIQASHRRPGKSVEVRLAREMIAVVQGESRTLEEKERMHKLAMVNRGNMIR